MSTPTRRGPYRDALNLAALPGQWRFEAACKPETGDDFHPLPKGDTRAAKTVCRTECTVRLQCLTYAMQHDDTGGIWGGFTELERRALRRQKISPADAIAMTSPGTLSRAVRGGRHGCPHCPASYAYLGRLTQHIRRTHPEAGAA